MPLPNNFYTVANTNLHEIDENFAAIGALTPIPVTFASGSAPNTLYLSPSQFSPQVFALQNYMQFTGIALFSNTGPVMATFLNGINPPVPTLPVIKDTPTGPVPLTGGELIPGTVFSLMFDQQANGGNGAFHLGPSASSFAGSFLPLGGGTLTGPVVGPAATFTSGSIGTLSATTAAMGAAAVTGALTASAATIATASIATATVTTSITAPSAAFTSASITSLTGPLIGPAATFTAATITNATETTATIATLAATLASLATASITTASIAAASIATAAVTTSLTAPSASITTLLSTTETVATASIATATITNTITAPSALFTAGSIGTLTATNETVATASITTASIATASIATATVTSTITAPAAAFTASSIGTLTATNETVANASIAALHVTTSLTAPAATITAATISTISPAVATPYSTGTWTPTDASGAGLVITVTSATFTQVGNLVFARANITYPSTANSAFAQVSGLPFPVVNRQDAIGPGLVLNRISQSGLIVYANQGTSNAVFFNNGTNAQVLNSALSGQILIFNVVYATS